MTTAIPNNSPVPYVVCNTISYITATAQLLVFSSYSIYYVTLSHYKLRLH